MFKSLWRLHSLSPHVSSQRILVSNCWMFHMMLKVHRRPKCREGKGAFPITSQRHGSQFGESSQFGGFWHLRIPKPYKWSLNGTEKRNGGSLRIGENPLWDAVQHLCCSSILWGNLFPKVFGVARSISITKEQSKRRSSYWHLSWSSSLRWELYP